MASFSPYLENAILESVFRGASFPSTSTVYLGLFTASNELSPDLSPGYTRKVVASAAWSEPVATPTGTTISNGEVLEFAGAQADWQGPISHFGLFDAATEGNLLFKAPLGTPRVVEANDMLRFAPGALTIRID